MFPTREVQGSQGKKENMADCIIVFVYILTLNLEGPSFAFICSLFTKRSGQVLC